MNSRRRMCEYGLVYSDEIRSEKCQERIVHEKHHSVFDEIDRCIPKDP
jgi:hypothetical protein